MKMLTNAAQLVASKLAYENCKRFNPASEWAEIHEERIELIMQSAPSGGGFDCGTKLESLARNKIVFSTQFHHMNENGFYDGWTSHKIIVTPSFVGGFDLKVTGPDRNQIKDYIAETFSYWLSRDYDTRVMESRLAGGSK